MNHTKRKLLGVLGLGLALTALAPEAHARRGLGRANYSLSVAGGIASSSKSLAAFQNPAALIYGDSLDLDLHAAESGGDLGFGAGVLFGGLDWGGVIGAQHFTGDRNSTRAYYGLAASIRQMKLAFGLSGRTQISPGSGTEFDLGMLVNPMGEVRLGFTLSDLSGGISALGAGIAYEAASSLTLVADVTSDTDFDFVSVAPGVLIGNQNAAFTLGYGIKAKGEGFGSHAFHEKWMGGLTLRLGKVQWTAHYQQPSFAKYYTSLTIDF
jgi:hypothetical protein